MYHPPLWLVALMSTFFGLYLARKAQKDGRNKKFWFWIGFAFGISGLIAYSICKKNEVKAILKTRISPQSTPQILYSDKPWYYVDEERNSIGPLSYFKLKELLQNGIIDSETLVWNEDLEVWTALNSLFK